MSTKQTAVQKVEPAGVPDYVNQDDRRGTEHITREDVRIPRLSLAQSQSPQLLEDDPNHIENLKPGQAFNDVTGEIYGSDPLNIIIVRADKPRWVEFSDRSVIDPNVPAGDPRTQFTTDPITNERVRPKATMFYDYVVLIGESHEPAALSFKGSGIKSALRLNALLRLKPIPIFAGRYQLVPSKMKNDMGTWFIFTVKQNGFVSKEEYALAESSFETWKDKEVPFDQQAGEDPAPEL